MQVLIRVYSAAKNIIIDFQIGSIKQNSPLATWNLREFVYRKLKKNKTGPTLCTLFMLRILMI